MATRLPLRVLRNLRLDPALGPGLVDNGAFDLT
jgi:hypothetical protein